MSPLDLKAERSLAFDPKHGEQSPISGYIGATTIVILSLIIAFSKVEVLYFGGYALHKSGILMGMVLVVFITMLCAEYFGRADYVKRGFIEVRPKSAAPSDGYLLKSALYRFGALFFMFYVMYYTIHNHYYFANNRSFDITREFFDYLMYIYVFLGLPYTFFTLKYRWGRAYEFNDYGILTLLFFRALLTGLFGWVRYDTKALAKAKTVIANRRARKVALVYLVNFFFLTLMVQFLQNEYTGFENAVNTILNDNFSSRRFFEQYHTWYLVFFHLLFVIDVGIAIIGYTVASRWLDNRTRSVDMTMGGWFVAIMCYPPMNSGFSGYFISYSSMQTHNVVSSEPVLMVLMALILAVFFVYVWATVALGLKFSNLTHRGIVTTGPYRVVRHPAYVSKNFAWWLDNTFVLSNIWASLGLLAWNIVYALRGITEERHLKKDPKYNEYCERVKWRFIPGVI